MTEKVDNGAFPYKYWQCDGIVHYVDVFMDALPALLAYEKEHHKGKHIGTFGLSRSPVDKDYA